MTLYPVPNDVTSAYDVTSDNDVPSGYDFTSGHSDTNACDFRLDAVMDPWSILHSVGNIEQKVCSPSEAACVGSSLPLLFINIGRKLFGDDSLGFYYRTKGICPM